MAQLRSVRWQWVLGLVLAGACTGPEHSYPETVRQRWLQGCESAPSEQVCRCALEAVQREIPYEDFRAFEEGEPPYRSAGGGQNASPQWDAMNRRIAELSEDCAEADG